LLTAMVKVFAVVVVVGRVPEGRDVWSALTA
jgi:hypothetical protein